MSVDDCIYRRFPHQQGLHRLHDLLEHRIAVQIALLQQLIGPHSGMDRGILTVLFHEDICGAVNIYIRNHDYGVFMVDYSSCFPLTPSAR